jgi:hypothetical protein
MDQRFTPCEMCGRLGLSAYCSPGCAVAALTLQALERDVFPESEKENVVQDAADMLGTWPEVYRF